MDRDELLTIVDRWSIEELSNYIGQLENRVIYTRSLIKELKQLHRRKTRKTTPDNGPRDGR